MDAIERNETWELVDLLISRIKNYSYRVKWTSKLKYNLYGSVKKQSKVGS